MPPLNAPPKCPKCQSTDGERLPFDVETMTQSFYSCRKCGHVWRHPSPVKVTDPQPRKKRASND